jgi:NAD(P)-dependent dehydrogenase (short-subunit alcohol dehydrogenase family)
MTAAQRRIVITGGSGGIGGAIVRHYLQQGDYICNIDMRPAAEAPRLTTILADIADADAINQAFSKVDAAFGGRAPDIFIGCAAISRAAHVLDVTPAEIDMMLSINVRGGFLTVQAAACRMAKAKAGSIVLISSVAAEQAWASESIYCATKAATRALMQGLAMELAPFNIRVNAIGPGPIDHVANDMASTRADPEVYRHEIERTPFQRFGTPEEIAQAVAMIADAPWVTGQTLYVDGGFLATGLGFFGAARDKLLFKKGGDGA